MSTEVLLLYLATWSLVALTPGPAVMCAMSQATRYGFRHALAGIIGIQLGHFVFFGCVASGLVALLAAATTAFTVLRMVGAVYLFYLGVRIMASTFRRRVAEPAVATAPPRGSLLLQGFAIQVTNPKALLFMSALLPQFIQPQHSLALQLCVLLATTITVDMLVLSSYACFAMRGAQSLRASGVIVWLERAFGAALVLFGIRLFADRK
jgi:homoserine/homoserine lactone efflux protein